MSGYTRNMSIVLSTLASVSLIVATGVWAGASDTSTHGWKGGNHSASSMMSAVPSQGVDADASSQDRSFLKKAAQVNLLEIQAGKLVVKQGQSQAAKNFAKRMIHDHTQLQAQLQQLGHKVDVGISTSLDAKHKAVFDQWSKLQGAALDQAYLHAMVQGHKKAITLFKTESHAGANLSVMNWATEATAILKIHEKLAQTAAKNL